jgi:lipoprotein-releasing system ATP-binding protein
MIETHELTRTLGAVRQIVLHPTTLSIARGEFVALTGPSGSGKSTLLYLLGVLDRPTSGSLRIDGVETNRLSDDERARLRRERLGFVFQFHFLLPEFTVRENVELPMLRRGDAPSAARRRAIEALERLDLATLRERRPHELSGGQQQRASIARAVAGRPSLLLADEPTGALDSKNGDAVMQFFAHLNHQDGMTIVIVTHDVGFAQRTTRQVALKDGTIVQEGSGRIAEPSALGMRNLGTNPH